MKKIKKVVFLLPTIALGVFPSIARAAIENPVISDALGGTAADSNAASSGSIFTSYFVRLWSSLVSIGAILVLIYFFWGAINWIGAGGDSGKVEAAREKITHAIVGLIILVGSYVFVGFISDVFFGTDFNILNLSLPDST